MSEFPQVPAGNGLIKCCKEETRNETHILAIQAKLKAIVDGFVPTFDEPTLTTQYTVGKYIQLHEKDTDYMPINGDSAEFCLAYSTEDATSESGV